MARSILWRCATLRYGAIYTMATSDPKVWRDTHYGDAGEYLTPALVGTPSREYLSGINTLSSQWCITMAMHDPKVWRDLYYGDARP